MSSSSADPKSTNPTVIGELDLKPSLRIASTVPIPLSSCASSSRMKSSSRLGMFQTNTSPSAVSTNTYQKNSGSFPALHTVHESPAHLADARPLLIQWPANHPTFERTVTYFVTVDARNQHVRRVRLPPFVGNSRDEFIDAPLRDCAGGMNDHDAGPAVLNPEPRSDHFHREFLTVCDDERVSRAKPAAVQLHEKCPARGRRRRVSAIDPFCLPVSTLDTMTRRNQPPRPLLPLNTFAFFR